MKKIRVLSKVLIAAVFFASCEVFNEPVKDYFVKYTDNVNLAKQEFVRKYPKDPSGIINVSSDDDCEIVFYLLNPQNYDLRGEKTFITSPISSSTQGFNNIKLVQDGDKSTVRYYLPKEFLTDVDGKDQNYLTSKIILVEPNSGRTFEFETEPMKANSAPPKVRDLCVMLEGTALDQKYVLCFNAPKLDVIHYDTKVLQITHNDNTKTFDINPSSPNAEKMLIDTGNANANGLYTSFEGTLSPISEGATDFNDLKTTDLSFYYKTGVNVTENQQSFVVTLIDKDALKSDTKISNKSVKLGVPTFNFANNAILEQTNKDGTANLVINFPTVDDGNNAISGGGQIYYYVLQDNILTSTEVLTANDKVELTINPGPETKVYAYAAKDYYSPSTKVENTYTVKMKTAYVNENGADSVENKRIGTLSYPFKTLNETSSGVYIGDIETIRVVGDITESNITPVEGKTYYELKKPYILEGCDQNGDDCVNTINVGSKYLRLDVESATNFVIKNLNVIADNSKAAIFLSSKKIEGITYGSSVTLKDGAYASIIQLQNVYCCINVASKLTTTQSNPIKIKYGGDAGTAAILKEGNVVLQPIDGYTLTQSDIDKFSLENTEWQIKLIDGCGKLSKKPVVNIIDFDKVEFEGTTTGPTATAAEKWDWSKKYTIKIGTLSSEQIAALVTKRTITVTQGATEVKTITQQGSDLNNDFEISLENCHSGSYQVIVTATINGVEHSITENLVL